MHLLAILFLTTAGIFRNIHATTRVLELNDRFLEIAKDGNWFIMFYSPTCAWCSKLEPIWSQVQQALYASNIRVCRIDCHAYSKTCIHYNIHKLPTIIFLNGEDRRFIYNGEKTKDDIIHFAARVSGPPVKTITDKNILHKFNKDNVTYFAFYGPSKGELWIAFQNVAIKFHASCYFYHISEDIPEHIGEIAPNVIFVRKENKTRIFYENDVIEDLDSSLFKWVNEERFPSFAKVTPSNFDVILESKKYLVLAVVEENKVHEIPSHMLQFRDMFESIIKNHEERFRKHFQFGWIGRPQLGNSIVMERKPLPYVIVLNSTTFHHHLPEDDPHQLTSEAAIMFLESVLNESSKAYGGNSISTRLYRMYFDVLYSLSEMWKGNPILTTVIFGMPLGFFSLIFYSMCCSDILDANDDDEEDTNEDLHEKRD